MEQRPDVTKNNKPLAKKTQNALMIGFSVLVAVAVFAAVMVI